MYAVNNSAAEYKICFGGNYKERWSNDYTLSIEYSGRREVTAKLQNGCWHAVDGDKELAALLESDACPQLTRQYF